MFIMRRLPIKKTVPVVVPKYSPKKAVENGIIETVRIKTKLINAKGFVIYFTALNKL